MNRRFLWERTAFLCGFLVAALAFLLHTRTSWFYFQPGAADLAALAPRPGPFFVGEWSRHVLRLAMASLFFLSLPGLGRLLLPAGRAFSPFAAAGLGLLAWGMIGFFMAAAELSRPLPLRIVSVLLIAAGLAREAPRLLPELRRRLTSRVPYSAPQVLLIAFCAMYLLTTVVPEVFYDALVYHLAAPQAWLQNGRMTDMPDIHQWRLPGLMQTLSLWALAWSDERLSKLLHVGIGFLTAGHLSAWAGGRWGKSAGLWAALLFLSSPLVGVNLWSFANDIPAGFFCFLSLAMWLEGWKADWADWLSFFLAGLFLGAGGAVKTTALFAGPYFLWDALRRRRGAGAALGLFGAGFLIPLAPWWIRAALWTGNPFFPHAASLLGGDRATNLALLPGWHAEAGGDGGIFFRASSLLRESVRGVEGGRFGFVGPALLMLLPLGFFLRPGGDAGALAAYALASYAAFALATGRLRYFLPHLPPLFALAGACLTEYAAAARGFGDRLVRRLGPALQGLAAAAVFLNLVALVLVFHRFNQGWDAVWGRQSSADYLKVEHIGVYGHPSQGAFDWLAAHGAAGRLFVMGEARTFRSPIPAAAAGAFNVPPYALWAGDPPSAERVLNGLRAGGFTYLLINVEEVKRITPPPYKTDAYLKALGALFDRLAPPLYRDRWCILFQVPIDGAAV